MTDNANITGTLNRGKASRLRILAGYLIVAAFLIICAWYVYSHEQDFAFVASVSIPETVSAGLLIAASFLVAAYQLGLFLKNFGLNLGAVELTALAMGMILGNLVTPMRGGTAALALYLKRTHGLDFTSSAVIYGGTALLIALINAGLAVMGLAVLALFHGFFHPALSIMVGGVFVCCLYLSVFPPPVKWRGSGLLGMVFRAADSWHELTRKRGLLLRLAASFFAVSLALAAALYLIYCALGTAVNPLGVLIASGMGNVANLIPLTPGSLGIFDAVVIEIPQFFGLDPARAIAGAVVFRVLSFFWAIALGIPGMFYLVRPGKQAP